MATALVERQRILGQAGMLPPQLVGAVDVTRRVDYFRSQVQNSGPWDYKQLGQVFIAASNFNFGATGAALGIPNQVLYRGAGTAQIIAGTSDQPWIDRGIGYFNSKCSQSP